MKLGTYKRISIVDEDMDTGHSNILGGFGAM